MASGSIPVKAHKVTVLAKQREIYWEATIGSKLCLKIVGQWSQDFDFLTTHYQNSVLASSNCHANNWGFFFFRR